MLKNLAFILGIDKAIFYTLLARGWGAASSLITLYLISLFLMPSEQGYYYTFASILGIQVIFELGFGAVLVQFVSHEMVGISLKDGKISGIPYHLSRLFYLIRLAIRWYAFISLFVLILIFPIGFVFFKNSPADEVGIIYWKLPWLFLVISSSLSLLVTPIISIAEGCGFISQIAKMRFIQSILSGLFAWFFLSLGHGLYAAGAASLSFFLVSIFWIKVHFYKIIKQAFCKNTQDINNPLSWIKEIFPIQWKIGLSWLCGYFIFQLFTPFAFKVFGSYFAGQLGLSLSLVTLMSTISLSWLTTKIPKFGFLIANNQYYELNILYNKVFLQSLYFLIFQMALAVLILHFSKIMEFTIATRFIPTEYFILLCITILGNHIVACQATFIRAHKVEKYLCNSIATAILVFLGLYVISYTTQAYYIIISYFLVIWGFCVPHSCYTFFQFKSACNIK
ncbi:hypothetical protein LGZ99_05710 [Photorhabdus temperata]|uniref:hypothetical protein n=1 Tax=Photorhabdus temperata TaxID=574560 RepID=UPI0021D501B7|nr:hypothetical protein [Photorhabdus temperata]MCT8346722.1 hypothetical protein [Photorhabdus temperata]